MIETPSILAALLTPGLLYAGLAGMAAPILIHLLARRRFKRIRWAAMEFLIDAERRNRRRLRMEEWILLALRCAALALIGLALARPFLDPAGLAAALRGAQRTERVFLIDDSFSMGYETADGSSFDRAKLAVRRILDMVRRESPDDTVTLVRMSDVTRPIDAGTYLDESQTQELLARLEALTPTARRIDAAQSIVNLGKLLDNAPGVTDAAIYVLSDFQRLDWARPRQASESSASSIFAPLQEWAGDERSFHVILVDLSADDPTNLALTELSVPAGKLVTGSDAVIRAVVANFADRSTDALDLQATVGTLVQPSARVADIPAGRTAAVEMRTTFLRPGTEPVRVELPSDALPIDNVRFMAAEVVSAIRMLIVNGDPSSDAFDDEVTYLKTALRPEGEAFSGNELTVVDEAQLDETNLDSFDVIILANVYRLAGPVIESLERFVRSGGGLMIFAGDQIDPDLYNATLFRQGEGPLPARLTERIRPSVPATLVLVDRLHPALRGLSGEDDPLGLGQVPFHVFVGCEPFAGADEADNPEAPITGSEDESNANGQPPASAIPSRVLARFDNAQESPAVVERTYGAGRVLLLLSSADKDWNSWPDHPTYLPLMMELTRSVARRSAEAAGRLVGAPIELEIDPNRFRPDAIVRSPAFPNESEMSVTGQTVEGRGLVVAFDRTDRPGFYQFVLTRQDGVEDIRSVAVNVDPDESDLTPATEAELRQTAGDIPLTYMVGSDNLAATAAEARTELWRLALVIALLVLVTEQSLAWFWGRRR